MYICLCVGLWLLYINCGYYIGLFAKSGIKLVESAMLDVSHHSENHFDAKDFTVDSTRNRDSYPGSEDDPDYGKFKLITQLVRKSDIIYCSKAAVNYLISKARLVKRR